MTGSPPKPSVLPGIQGQSRETLEAFLAAGGWPKYRLEQLLEWLYVHRVASWDAMTNLPKPLRAQLAKQFSFHTFPIVRLQGAPDSTRKFLWRLADGSYIESVLIPANPALYGEPSDRRTLCISTQVGCAYGCKFCASGLDGFKRNLAPEEIVEQVLAVERWHAAGGSVETNANSQPTQPESRLINNIVVMGMGEPLANYDNLIQALRILNAPWGGNIGARKITISTSGLAPQIRQLAAEPYQFRLAISLHGATDAVRSRLMPVNRKYPLEELIEACEDYLKTKGRMITFEYILIAGVNDGLDQVKPLAHLAKRLKAKVNLIPYNHVEGLQWRRPEDAVCEAFASALQKAGVTATLRREKGTDIDAACGQLRLKMERSRDKLGN